MHALPARSPDPGRSPESPVLVPPTRQTGPSRPGKGLVAVLCLVASLVTALTLALFTGPRTLSSQPGAAAGAMRTAVATSGELVQTLRVGGTVETRDFVAVRVPRMRGPRDSGRADLTIVGLAEPGTVVSAGMVVAEFELKWLEDHIEDRQSIVVREQSNYRKLAADIVILKETERQARVNARAEYDKAVLDLGTAEVRSEIEAEILSNVADEAQATWQQLEAERPLQQRVHQADLLVQDLKVQEEVLHVERHERDYERLQVRAPINGMVVRESMFNRSGQFAQSKEGDQIFPGALFMRIVDLSRMVVAASVNQVDAQSVRIGFGASVELDAYPGERFEGRVTEIGAVATVSGGSSKFRRPGSGRFVKQIPVRIAIMNSDPRILPDLSASADIRLSRSEEGVLVPREAVHWEAGGATSYVHVRADGRYVRRNVGVGGLSDTEALIAGGLEAGEEVLLVEPPDPGDPT